MEHVIQEHTLEYPEAHKGEVVLHCMSCDDWVSTQDTVEVVGEFMQTPCPGPRQEDPFDQYGPQSEIYKDEILPTTSGVSTASAEEKAALEEILSRHPDDYEDRCQCDHCQGNVPYNCTSQCDRLKEDRT